MVHPFHLGRPENALATEAAWCAADQNRFFEYQHTLYENFGMPFSQASLTNLTESIGLEQDTFSQCLSSGMHRTDVENARQAAARLGVNSTPTFFINGQRVEGNQPYQVFQNIINRELAAIAQ